MLGGLLIRANQIEIGSVMLDKVAYGWMDINRLLQD